MAVLSFGTEFLLKSLNLFVFEAQALVRITAVQFQSHPFNQKASSESSPGLWALWRMKAISVKGRHFPKMNPYPEKIHFPAQPKQTKKKHILTSQFSSVSDQKAGFLKSQIIPSREPKYSLKLQKRSFPILPVMSVNCDHLFSFQSHTLY